MRSSGPVGATAAALLGGRGRMADPQAGLSQHSAVTLRRIGALRVLLDAAPDMFAQPTVHGFTALKAKDALFADWLDETGAVAAVVRPDRYVYGIARSTPELEPLLNDLSSALFGT